MFLKNKNIIFKIRRSKVTEYAALTNDYIFFIIVIAYLIKIELEAIFTAEELAKESSVYAKI